MKHLIERIQSFWGTRLEPVLLPPNQNLSLPTETQMYLETVGLPYDDLLELDRNLLLRFIQSSGDIRIETANESEYIVLGKRLFRENILISNAGIRIDTGEFCFLHRPPNYLTIQFVNSNIQSFLAYAAVWLAFRPEYDANFQLVSRQSSGMYDKEIVANAERKLVSDLGTLKNEFMNIDPKALDTTADRFWVSTLEELEYTLSHSISG